MEWSRKKDQEWDWPPSRHHSYDARAEFVPDRTGWGSPTATKVINVYWWILRTIFKIFMAIACTIVLAGCGWFIIALLKLH
jgi:hypothetical protein